MPQMQHADRVRSALEDTWPDQTFTPAVPSALARSSLLRAAQNRAVELLNRFIGPRTRSVLCVDRMNDQCQRMRSGQGRQLRAARWRPAPALTRAQPRTNRKNHSVSPVIQGQPHPANLPLLRRGDWRSRILLVPGAPAAKAPRRSGADRGHYP